MRRKIDIQNDLQEVVNKFKAANEEDRVELRAKFEALQREFNDLLVVENTAKMLSKAEEKELKKFSFTKFIREASDGKLSGFEAEIQKEGEAEFQRLGQIAEGFCLPNSILRAAAGQNVTTAADGGNLVQEMGLNYLEALRAKLVLTDLGVRYLSGLVGDVSVVTSDTVNAAWGTEFQDLNTIQKVVFSKVVMKPRRMSFTLATSKQLLAQSSQDVEALLINEILNAHAQGLEKAAINGGGTAEPKGILATAGIGEVIMGATGAALSWAKVVELETKINTANADRGSLAYLTNPKVIGSAKTIEKATNTARFILENGQMNGYNVASTTLVPSDLIKTTENLSALIFGNFNDLVIGQWGGLDIIIDPYARKTSGEIEMTFNAMHDCLVTRPSSFAAIKDIITA